MTLTRRDLLEDYAERGREVERLTRELAAAEHALQAAQRELVALRAVRDAAEGIVTVSVCERYVGLDNNLNKRGELRLWWRARRAQILGELASALFCDTFIVCHLLPDYGCVLFPLIKLG